jgi:DNA primase
MYIMMTETYNQRQIKEILNSIGVHITSETSTDFLCLCPFHSNRHTPSFAVSYSKGLYVCYNPSCDAKGTLIELIKKVGDMNEFQAMRLIGTLKKESDNHFSEDLQSLFEEKAEFEEFPETVLLKLHNDLLKNEKAKNYFASRGINLGSIEYFTLGYSENMDMVTVPVHSPAGLPVGLVGRSIEGKRFKNSNDLPRSQTMFNLHRARKESSTIIVCESSFDAIRIHQSGFPNVVATLGGSLSKENIYNLNKYSSSIIIATDADEAGRKLGREIAFRLKNKNIMWASYGEGIIYPHDAKDVGDLTETEIYQCIKNAVSNFEYLNW